jgi:hypothetical protein
MISQCRRKGGAASAGVNAIAKAAVRAGSGRLAQQGVRNVQAKKSPLYMERAESISGGDMEETGTNIHIGLMRRNNFLRENPISGQNVAI